MKKNPLWNSLYSPNLLFLGTKPPCVIFCEDFSNGRIQALHGAIPSR